MSASALLGPPIVAPVDPASSKLIMEGSDSGGFTMEPIVAPADPASSKLIMEGSDSGGSTMGGELCPSPISECTLSHGFCVEAPLPDGSIGSILTSCVTGLFEYAISPHIEMRSLTAESGSTRESSPAVLSSPLSHRCELLPLESDFNVAILGTSPPPVLEDHGVGFVQYLVVAASLATLTALLLLWICVRRLRGRAEIQNSQRKKRTPVTPKVDTPWENRTPDQNVRMAKG